MWNCKVAPFPPKGIGTTQIWRKRKKCVRAIKKIYYTFPILCLSEYISSGPTKAEKAQSVEKVGAYFCVKNVNKNGNEVEKEEGEESWKKKEKKQLEQRQCEKWWWNIAAHLSFLLRVSYSITFSVSVTPSLVHQVQIQWQIRILDEVKRSIWFSHFIWFKLCTRKNHLKRFGNLKFSKLKHRWSYYDIFPKKKKYFAIKICDWDSANREADALLP